MAKIQNISEIHSTLGFTEFDILEKYRKSFNESELGGLHSSYGHEAPRKVSDRIVSIDRHYVRPIVRGKETKSVEFGAKLNNTQIDGISFIEHISFKAFNEGIRLKDCIRMSKS